MACKVVGKQVGKFTDRQTGELIEFAKLFVTYPSDGVEGEVAEECKLKPATIAEVSIGDDVRLERNQYGRVIAVDLV